MKSQEVRHDINHETSIHVPSPQAQLRRYENALVVSGTGIIAFGLWSIVKAALYYVLNPLDLTAFFSQQQVDQLGDLQNVMRAVVLVFIFLVLLIDLLMRVWVGRGAIRQGQGRSQKSRRYMVASVIIGIGLIMSIAGNFMILFEDTSAEEAARQASLQAASVSNIVDITSLMAVIEMVWASGHVRKLRTRLAAEAGREAEAEG